MTDNLSPSDPSATAAALDAVVTAERGVKAFGFRVPDTAISGFRGEDVLIHDNPDLLEEMLRQRCISLPVNKIKVKEGRRPLNVAKVAQLAESILRGGMLHPIVVRSWKADFVLVSGAHRLEAHKLLFGPDSCIQALVRVKADGRAFQDDNPADDLIAELNEIDENLIRNNPAPAEEAELTLRRNEIIKALSVEEGVSTQVVSKPSGRPKVAASVRDQATKTGKSREHVRRALKRGKALGTETLQKVRGTSLDKGVELDALAKLPEEECTELVERASAGEEVSARQVACSLDDGDSPRGQGQAAPVRPKVALSQKQLLALSAWLRETRARNCNNDLHNTALWAHACSAIARVIDDIEEGLRRGGPAEIPPDILNRQAERAFRVWRDDFKDAPSLRAAEDLASQLGEELENACDGEGE